MNDQNDLISRTQAKEEIAAWATVINKPQYLNREDAMHILDTLPAVAPPERTGRWRKEYYPYGDRNVLFRCSSCGAVDVHGVGQDVPYCWKCGAHMTEGDEHEKVD